MNRVQEILERLAVEMEGNNATMHASTGGMLL